MINLVARGEIFYSLPVMMTALVLMVLGFIFTRSNKGGQNGNRIYLD